MLQKIHPPKMSKSSSWHVKCSFGHPAGKISHFFSIFEICGTFSIQKTFHFGWSSSNLTSFVVFLRKKWYAESKNQGLNSTTAGLFKKSFASLSPSTRKLSFCIVKCFIRSLKKFRIICANFNVFEHYRYHGVDVNIFAEFQQNFEKRIQLLGLNKKNYDVTVKHTQIYIV